jgi:2,4-dienoyl-CoA reductase-like NADH-dependent reductase (Old Yellow Enzyme family)
MKNRFMMAPMTNGQSLPDGRISDEEHRWLTLRAIGGFGMTMTCAAHVQPNGQAFVGQLGVCTDEQLDGLSRLAAAVRREGSLAVLQLHHGGMRCPAELIGGTPVCPSDNQEFGARALVASEVEQLIEDHIAAALRAERAGFDGVEIHGAHGYILCQFLSPEINRRTDRYGGSLQNRTRIIQEIIAGIRANCGPGFNLGVRLSPERFGMRLPEVVDVAAELMRGGEVDYIDMSLWDISKPPADPQYAGRSLMSYFTELDRGGVRLAVAGAILNAEVARNALADGADFVILGRGAILHHDFPKRVRADDAFRAVPLPVSRDYLQREGLSPRFVDYLESIKSQMMERSIL